MKPAQGSVVLAERTTRPHTRITALVAGLAVIALAVFLAAPAHAAELGGVSSISIKDTYSELKLTFDRPISIAEASTIRATVGNRQAETVQPTSYPVDWPVYCWDYGGFGDSNGSFTYQYFCGTNRTMPWGFMLSATNQATVVGNVSEDGMRWWTNGYPIPRDHEPGIVSELSPVSGLFHLATQHRAWRHRRAGNSRKFSPERLTS